MAFIVPTFNLQADVFTWANPPSWVTPRITVDCQLRAPSMTIASTSQTAIGIGTGMILLVPAGTDLRDHFTTPGTHGDFIEVPPGSGRRYYCSFVDDVGRGFPNEHRFAVLVKSLGFLWPTPTP